ncbi:bestrophin, RFP-TM, chloride channel [Nitzschia inconspicua]|uniref:Bestrophin, RFP-TM, chloride channel n=1 Tax=Nitzschia inconspicua TaxID=303405 RepID=A0A9K3KL97_9STRA|nr:bestrophin, RFP-TM, chloride channel [Nitzschia inconspicua]
MLSSSPVFLLATPLAANTCSDDESQSDNNNNNNNNKNNWICNESDNNDWQSREDDTTDTTDSTAESVYVSVKENNKDDDDDESILHSPIIPVVASSYLKQQQQQRPQQQQRRQSNRYNNNNINSNINSIHQKLSVLYFLWVYSAFRLSFSYGLVVTTSTTTTTRSSTTSSTTSSVNIGRWNQQQQQQQQQRRRRSTTGFQHTTTTAATATVRLTLFPTQTGMTTTSLTRIQQQQQQQHHIHAYSSPLFVNPTIYKTNNQQQQQNHRRSSSYSSTALNMVLTTPESIIEQASTINLLDDLIDESVRTSARRPIMMQFDPSSGWIWRRWTGTIFSETWTSCVRNMVYALAVFVIQRTYPCINQNLSGFGTLWGQLLSVTTFTLTFFVNQSYSLWRKCMELSRRLQGRLHDINMNLASHAARKLPTNPTEKSTYTASSRQILELMSRYVRLFNLLTYASFTRSHRPILTPRGMRRLVERGLMTATEREVLVDAAIPATQRHSVVLMWMIRLFIEGRESGHIQGGAGFEAETMNKFHIIRSQYGAIGDELQGRMPLAYAHIVQVLVDLILWMFPIMAFSTGMSPLLVVVGTGLLTISYQGLFDLAKQFLDPYDNENYGRGEDPLCVDTLIAETNAGSVRWLYGFEELPYSAQRVRDGEMYDYLLPVRGYSVEELTQMEEERIEREKQLEEQRKREEEEEAAAAAAAAAAEEEEKEEKERLRQETENTAEQQELISDVGEEMIKDESKVSTIPELIDDVQNSVESVAIISPDSGNTTQPKERRKKSNKSLLDVDPSGNNTASVVQQSTTPPVDVVLTPNNITAAIKDQDTNKTASKVTTVEQSTTRVVHKVTTLKTGKPVTFVPPDKLKPVVEEPVPSNMQTTNYLATLSQEKQKKRKSSRKSISSVDENVLASDVVTKTSTSSSSPLLLLDDLSWFNETNPDGQEPKLPSETVADQDLLLQREEGEDDIIETKIMSLEEYQNRMKEVDQGTFEILSAILDVNGNEKLYTVTERKKTTKPAIKEGDVEAEPQTKVTMTLEDYNREVEEILTKAEEELRETEAILLSKPGTDPLGWDYDDEKLVPMSEEDDEVAEDIVADAGVVASQDSIASVDSTVSDMDIDDDGEQEAFAVEIETSLVGQSNIPTNGDTEISVASNEESRQTQDASQANEDCDTECLEEVAILQSKPGDDPVGWDYDKDQLAPMENRTKIESLAMEEEPENGRAEHNIGGEKAAAATEDVASDSKDKEESNDDTVKGSDIIQPIFLQAELDESDSFFSDDIRKNP